MLYNLRYRGPVAGVMLTQIDASSDAKAVLVGQAWCGLEPNRKFVGVSKSVVADESILSQDGYKAAQGQEAAVEPRGGVYLGKKD